MLTYMLIMSAICKHISITKNIKTKIFIPQELYSLYMLFIIFSYINVMV